MYHRHIEAEGLSVDTKVSARQPKQVLIRTIHRSAKSSVAPGGQVELYMKRPEGPDIVSGEVRLLLSEDQRGDQQQCRQAAREHG